MKTKLNIFRIALVLFAIVYMLLVLFYIIATFTGGHTVPREVIRASFLGNHLAINFYSYFMLDVIKDGLMIYALIVLLKVTDQFIKERYFTPKIINLMRIAGLLFIGVAFLGILISIFYHTTFSEHVIESLLLPGMIHFMTLIIGLGLLVIEETYHKGFIIKTENDLTI
ncbi:DUF2975 domain-containing protein [Winogradskyella sp.]|uniref:DUF2975 domain-containing protein n=1 Tax=Winogradskyella sp. TaxID=1883156 RepID=UPI002632B41B|nr:DUF2975 domain-containing protein [Winogradskyella sp.]